jgi:hypothetical protein
MRTLAAVLVLALSVVAAAAAVRTVSPAGTQSAAYWRDMCTGQQRGIAHAEQDRMCLLYLSSFHDAADEYGEAGHKMFCPREAITVETMRRDFLVYVGDLPESAEFLPVGRAVLLALMRAYPCSRPR